MPTVTSARWNEACPLRASTTVSGATGAPASSASSAARRRGRGSSPSAPTQTNSVDRLRLAATNGTVATSG